MRNFFKFSTSKPSFWGCLPFKSCPKTGDIYTNPSEIGNLKSPQRRKKTEQFRRYLNRSVCLGAGEGFEPPTSGLWARRATKLLYPAIFNWCRRPGSNRYGIIVPQDFKSWASASSATPASSRSDSVSAKALLLYHLRIVLSRGFHKLFLKNALKVRSERFGVTPANVHFVYI